MDIPETFKPKKLKVRDLEYLKKPINNIDSLILGESFFDCNKKYTETWDLTFPILANLGVNTKHIEKEIRVVYSDETRKQFGKYGVGNSEYTIKFVQYRSKNYLDKDLENLFDKGIKFYKSKDKFLERFLFKDKIAMYVNGNKEFIKKSVNYYRKLGFKQLSCTIKVV